jgi:hypothetical protein
LFFHLNNRFGFSRPLIELGFNLRIFNHTNDPQVHCTSNNISVFPDVILIATQNQSDNLKQLLLQLAEVDAVEDELRLLGFTHLLHDFLEDYAIGIV